MSRCILPFMTLVFLSLAGRAQSDTSGISSVKIDRDYFRSYCVDAKDFLSAPARWKTCQVIGATAVLGGTLFLITQDETIRHFFVANQSDFTGNASKYFFDPMGSGLYSLPALGIMYGIGALFHDGKAKGTALKGVEAYLLAALFTQVIKQATHRHRPYQDDPPDPYAWDGPVADIHYNSFPSGHSSAIFAIATVVAFSYSKTIWVPLVCYSIATMTALSRLAVNEHWASDVLMGSALGFGIGQLVFNGSKGRVRILPASPTGLGCTILIPIK